MSSPLEIRRALARLPQWTQSTWSYLTGIVLRPPAGRPWRARTHVLGLILAWLLTMSLGISAVKAALTALFSRS